MTHQLLEGPALSTLDSLQGALLRHDVLETLDDLSTKPGLPKITNTRGAENDR